MSNPASTSPQWPPRSPLDALLSTPGGRRRLAEARTSPSPSPLKRATSAAAFHSRAADILRDEMADDDEEEEDEETLQLKLQEIQARLKLKRLQKSKAAEGSQNSDQDPVSRRPGTGSISRAGGQVGDRARSAFSQRREETTSRARDHVEVPVSPIRKVQPRQGPKSPSRVLLGIDKGRKANDISLKRAPSLRKGTASSAQDEGASFGGYLRKSESRIGNRERGARTPAYEEEAPRPASFSERMASVRNEEINKRERKAHIEAVRSKSFGIGQEEMEHFKSKAVDIPDAPRETPQFTREEVMAASNRPASGLLRRSRSTPAVNASSSSQSSQPARPSSRGARKPPASEMDESEASQFEPYSSIHLSKRILPHNTLTRTFTGKKVMLLPETLKVVKAPDFALPDIEEDIVLIAIVAKKSAPIQHKNSTNSSTQGKFMILTLTDLKWELELFLFQTGFDRFWKLTEGTIIAILNPMIMAPKDANTGRFSVVINSSEDTVLEIGMARDLGFCKSVKKDGKPCNSWIDARHTEFCEYHTNEAVKKTKASRMEVNTMDFGMGGRSSRFGGARYNSRDITGWKERKEEEEKAKRTFYDGKNGTQVFVSRGMRSTADLLDDAYFEGDAFHRGNKEERMRKRLEKQEKEKDIASRLARAGGGLGRDYMGRQSGAALRPEDMLDAGGKAIERPEAPPVPDAGKLGLLAEKGKAKQIHLSPMKRRRESTVMSSSSAAGAVGWGSGLRDTLGKMKKGESLQQPVAKKTRFVTERGIKEAGRDSLGGESMMEAFLGKGKGRQVVVDDDDDDDDLDIVRE